MLSDHSTIVAQLDLLIPQDHTTVRRVQRNWRQFDFDRFNADLRQSTLVCDSTVDDNVDDLFDRYDRTLRSLLDVHAPTKSVCVRAARSAPWYDADCRAEKKVTRRLEKVYRRSRSTADRLLWSAQFNHQRSSFQQKLRDYWLTIRVEMMLDCCGPNYGTSCHRHRSDSRAVCRPMNLRRISRRRLRTSERRLLLHPRRRLTIDLLLRCRLSLQSLLMKSHACCPVRPQSTVNSIQCRPGL